RGSSTWGRSSASCAITGSTGRTAHDRARAPARAARAPTRAAGPRTRRPGTPASTPRGAPPSFSPFSARRARSPPPPPVSPPRGGSPDRLVEEGADRVARCRAADPPSRRRRLLRPDDLVARETPRRRAGRGVVPVGRGARARGGTRALVLRGEAPLAFAPHLRLSAMEHGRRGRGGLSLSGRLHRRRRPAHRPERTDRARPPHGRPLLLRDPR